MTQERIDAIAEVLNADVDRAKALINMDPAAAAQALQAEGYDFSAAELSAFGEIIAKASAPEELDLDALDDVAGGISKTSYINPKRPLPIIAKPFVKKQSW